MRPEACRRDAPHVDLNQKDPTPVPSLHPLDLVGTRVRLREVTVDDAPGANGLAWPISCANARALLAEPGTTVPSGSKCA